MVNNGYVYLKIEKRRKTGKELSHAQAPGAQRQSGQYSVRGAGRASALAGRNTNNSSLCVFEWS